MKMLNIFCRKIFLGIVFVACWPFIEGTLASEEESVAKIGRAHV